MKRSRWSWAVLALAPLVLGACDWTQIGFDAANTHANADEPALTNASVRHLTEAWSTPDADASVVVAGGAVYTHRTSGPAPAPDTAHALDVTTGAVRWTASVPHADVPVAVGNGIVYYSQGDGGTVALDAATGVQRWSSPLTSVALSGTRLFAVSAYNAGTGRSAELAAIDPSGGKLWSTTTGGEVTGGVVRAGHLVVSTYIALDSAPHGIVVLSTYDESNGSLLRRVAVPAADASGNITAPANTRMSAGSGLVYFVTSSGSDLFAVDPDTGAVVWHLARPGIAGFAVAPTALVVTSSGATGTVSALDPITGATRWSTNAAGSVLAPTVSDDLVFVGHTQSDPPIGLLIYDLANGTLVASSSTLCCGPTPADGRIFGSGLNGLQAMIPS
jgi:outer membrane protein assembly factor BamB